MKHFFLLFFCLFIFHNFSLKANYNYTDKKSYNVGNEPVAVFYDSVSAIFHIFCKGTDKNFNGIFEPDSGDVKPSWWTLKEASNGDIEVKKVYDFDFASIPFPFRPAFNSAERIIYINHINYIQGYSLDNYTPINQEHFGFTASGLDYQNGELIITKSSQSNSIDTVILFNPKTQNIIVKYPVGINSQQSLGFDTYSPDKIGLAVLNVGPFGSDSSNVQFDNFDENSYPQFDVVGIGNTGNHISMFGNNYIVATSMFSGTINLINMLKKSFTPIYSKSNTWNGPSFSKLIKMNYVDFDGSLQSTNYLISVNYDAKMEMWLIDDLNKNDFSNEYSSIDIDGKGESFDYSFSNNEGSYYSSNFVVAPSLKTDYTPNNTINYIKFVTLVSVDKKQKASDVQIFPNPAKNFITIKTDYDNFNIKIYNNLGNCLLSTKSYNNLSNIDLSNIKDGIYYVEISNSSHRNYNKLIIAK